MNDAKSSINKNGQKCNILNLYPFQHIKINHLHYNYVLLIYTTREHTIGGCDPNIRYSLESSFLYYDAI